MGKDCVVEILGIDGVNRDERQVADIFTRTFDFGQSKGLGFLNDVFGEGDADIILMQANQAGGFSAFSRANDFRDFCKTHIALIAA